jgi:glycerol-3-phosphate O-acyltransferase
MREEEFYKELETLSHQIPPKYHRLLMEFFDAYKRAVLSIHDSLPTLFLYLLFIKQEIQSPFTFEPYHKKVRHPLDYYQFGIDFIKPLVDLPHSKIEGIEHLDKINRLLQKKENVILLANHQTESDPQAISVLLEKTHPAIAESIIYVAGERVVTDPLAIPFSMGCDLLCIYSKRYINHPPEKKTDKQLHNKKTMQLMSRLLEEGGKIIYVAPSGGRDRKNKDGIIEVAPLDPDSIEMFHLMARRSQTPTHFIPFTLATYDLLPPPETVQSELGESRNAKRTPIHLSFSPPFDMDHFPGSEKTNKLERREARANVIWNIIYNTYQNLIK